MAPPGEFSQGWAPESLTSYEVGVKSYWWDRRLLANLALFYSKYRDIQYSIGTGTVAEGQPAQAYNLGKATIDGAEVDLSMAPISDLTLSFSGAYLHWKIDEVTALANTVFDPATGSGSPYQVGENIAQVFSIEYAPKFSLNLAADYTFAHFDSSKLSVHLDYVYKGYFFNNPFDGPATPNTHFDTLPSQSLFNGRLILAGDLSHGGRLQFSVWCKNLLDRNHLAFVTGNGPGGATFENGAAVGYTSTTGAWAEPRSYGVQVQYNYQ
jgi:iron complex outermembrane receptor protein